MTKEEADCFINKLPVLDIKYFPSSAHADGRDTYAYVLAKEGCNRKEYLLETGEVVKGAERKTNPYYLRNYLIDNYTYLGIGILHKRPV